MYILILISIGFPAKVFVTIAGAEHVKPGSLRIKVVEEKGSLYEVDPLIAVGTSGVRHFLTFLPPSGPFKLQLHGQTRHGSSFIRESSSYDQTVPVLLKLSYREDSNILRRDQSTSILIKILRGNTGPLTQEYTLNMTDTRSYGHVCMQPRPVYRERQGFATIKFKVPADAPAATTLNAKISLIRKGETSSVASLMFSFLLV